MSGLGEVIAETLTAHWAKVGPITGRWVCTCGAESTNGAINDGDLTARTEREIEYRAHVAATVERIVADREAALREQIARDIESGVLPSHPSAHYKDGHANAARIARGGAQC